MPGRVLTSARLLHVTVAGALLLSAAAATAAPSPQAGREGVSIRITSPLGRTGVQGRIRIVAQIVAPDPSELGPVSFFMNDMLLGQDGDGAPYAIDWVDDNPFERCELRVEVTDGRGVVHSDTIVLQPFEILEEAKVTSVLIEAAVRNPAGRYVGGLTAGDFTVTEDGIPQKLDLAQQVDVPTAFALLVDSSQSMSRRMDFVRLAAARLALRMRRDDRVLVVPFANGPQAVTGPTNDRTTITEAISTIAASGGTAILDSLAEAARLLQAVEAGRKVIVLITDGYDENSSGTAEETLTAVSSAHASVFVVAIGGVAGISLKGERFLRDLAAQTGGRAFFPPREESLAPMYDILLEDIVNRYLLTYTPSNQTADGKFRKLGVQVEGEGLTVQARDGYLAPKPPPVRPSIEFTVTDNDLKYVDISAEDLIVVEDGVEQEVASFQEAVLPVSIVLALDTSGSMRRAAEAAVQAAHQFVDALREEDSLGIVLFSDGSVFAQDLSKDRQASHRAIDGYEAVGGTALYDALSDSLYRLGRAEGRRVVVLVTDGRDENNPGTAPGSLATLPEVLEAQRATGASIFAIGLGTSVDRETLQTLADRSGGRAYFPVDVATLPGEYTRIVEDLRRRFVLTYTSTNPARDGAWRNVEIRTRMPNHIVRSAGGFFAPAR